MDITVIYSRTRFYFKLSMLWVIFSTNKVLFQVVSILLWNIKNYQHNESNENLYMGDER